MQRRSQVGVFALCAVACALGSGCASIVHGSNQEVAVTSDPPGALVTLETGESRKTPTKFKLSRKSDHVLTITKDGYQTEQVQVMKTISGAVAGNIIAGGLIGWGVDAVTGAQYKLVPGTVTVHLRSAQTDQPVLARQPVEMTPDDRLRRLDQLHKEALLTDDEYKITREMILKELGGG